MVRTLTAPHPAPALTANLRLVRATAITAARNKIMGMGPLFYAMVWVSFPVFMLMSITLIYRENAELRNYAIIAGAGVALLFAMLFGASEILDTERQRGTLGNLFLSPGPRYAWLAGFQVFNLGEALLSGTVALTIGSLMFGIDLNVNVISFLVVMVLFVAAMWGFSMAVGAIGVAIRNGNQLSNLLFSPILLVAGTMYPVDRMPDWLRIAARCLPFSYGMESLVASLTTNASVVDLADSLVPLAGFAIVLPLIGIAAFTRLERMSKNTGSLELM